MVSNALGRKQSAWFDARTIQQRLPPRVQPGPRVRATLARAAGKPGAPTDAELDALYRATIDEAHRKLIASSLEARRYRTVESIDKVLFAIKQVESLPEPNERLIELVGRQITSILQGHESSAYQSFRQFPSKENYAKCWAARRNLDLLGLDEQRGYPFDPAPRCRIRPPLKPGRYTVVAGDWLSKIAQRYYGEANLWDFIFETNGYDGDPDLITPGTVLNIQNGT